jgi:hypothetical protein
MAVDDHDRRLGEALEEADYPPSVVAKARAGHWSDFKTELALPKMDLADMLHRDGHLDLRRRVMEGEFDG